MFPHFQRRTLIFNYLQFNFEPHPDHNKNGIHAVFIGFLRDFRRIVVITKIVENGIFWSILAKCFPIVSPLNHRWGNAKQKSL